MVCFTFASSPPRDHQSRAKQQKTFYGRLMTVATAWIGPRSLSAEIETVLAPTKLRALPGMAQFMDDLPST
jgi:hypothetical protein